MRIEGIAPTNSQPSSDHGEASRFSAHRVTFTRQSPLPDTRKPPAHARASTASECT
jgi:hypothetical protein